MYKFCTYLKKSDVFVKDVNREIFQTFEMYDLLDGNLVVSCHRKKNRQRKNVGTV